jgi:microcystin-dependent protein
VGDAVATHEGKTVAHTPAQCGAEPSGAVAQHVEDYAHFSLSAIQALFDAQRLKQNPIGSCFLNYGSTAPEYSIEPAGQLLNRADYPSLWQHAQDNDLVISDNNWTVGGISEKTFFSSGNGSTNFRVPRLGGLFPRFADRGAGIDVSLLVGTYKADQNKEHDHTTDEQGNHWHIGTTNSDGEHTHTVSYGVYDENGGGKKVGSGDSSKFEQAGDGITINAAGSHTHTFSTSEVGLHSHTTDQSGGSEARPKSVAFLLCMWAK